MSAHLRPTTPRRPANAPATFLPATDVERAIACGGAVALGIYGSIVALRSAGEPCTVALLAHALGDDEDLVARTVQALLDAELIAWVEEPEEGGEA